MLGDIELNSWVDLLYGSNESISHDTGICIKPVSSGDLFVRSFNQRGMFKRSYDLFKVDSLQPAKHIPNFTLLGNSRALK